MSKLDRDKIKIYLTPQNRVHAANITLLKATPSTNDYLSHLPHDHRKRMAICLAETQTAGKGRYGRPWISPYGANIYLSLRTTFHKPLCALTPLSLLVAQVIKQALAEFGIADIEIKPPNDILWHHKKLAGILIETKKVNVLINNKKSNAIDSVIGIGINVNMPENLATEIDQPWVDIKQIIGRQADRNVLAGLLLNHLIAALRRFSKRSPYEA